MLTNFHVMPLFWASIKSCSSRVSWTPPSNDRVGSNAAARNCGELIGKGSGSWASRNERVSTMKIAASDPWMA